VTDRPDEPASDEPIDAELVNPHVTGREAYNVISDTVTGVNVRVSDNVFQAIAIFICLALVSRRPPFKNVFLLRWLGDSSVWWWGCSAAGYG
jgi:hypothetical protein